METGPEAGGQGRWKKIPSCPRSFRRFIRLLTFTRDRWSRLRRACPRAFPKDRRLCASFGFAWKTRRFRSVRGIFACRRLRQFGEIPSDDAMWFPICGRSRYSCCLYHKVCRVQGSCTDQAGFYLDRRIKIPCFAECFRI